MSRKKQEDEEEEPPKTRREKIAALVESVNKRMGTADGKSSVADFIRLLEYQREIEAEEQPREMKVTWSEPLETYDTDE